MNGAASARWYSVRCVFEMRKGPSWTPRKDDLREYEERITIWRAESFEAAIARAEADAREYASNIEVEYVGLAQAYALDEDVHTVAEGTEVFSLIRTDNRAPAEYLDRYFDTGSEYQQTLRYERQRRTPGHSDA